MSSSDSDSSGSDSGSGSSSEASAPVQADQATKRVVPPIIQRKLQLRNQLDMFQVDEELNEFEEEKVTITGKTATDFVAAPNNIKHARISR